MTFTASDVAAWMMERLTAEKALYQDMAATEIYDSFGAEFTTINTNGNMGISKAVLTAFTKVSGDGVVWCRGDRYWRQRENYDLPGRMQP